MHGLSVQAHITQPPYGLASIVQATLLGFLKQEPHLQLQFGLIICAIYILACNIRTSPSLIQA